jgi:DNA-binding winged helix-turn-helix (wHTH) protein/Tol biopolymer transport system component
MAAPPQRPSVISFGAFQLNAANGELRKAGRPVKIHPQPFRVLLLLAERSGQIVTREEIRHCLWGDNTVVEFEGGINFCIRQIRTALDDEVENPRYLQTLPRRGYRFIASTTFVEPAEGHIPALTVPVAAEIYKEDGASGASAGTASVSLPDANGIALPASTGSDLPSRRRRGAWWLAGGLVIVLLATSLLVKRPQRLPFEHFTIQRVSAGEHVRMTAISPDGIYLASVLSEANGVESLWVHHLPTGSERHVEQDAAFEYDDVKFSPDGNYIYFRVKNATASASPERYELRRIAILGGRSVHILGNVDFPISFTGGGQRVCFYRLRDFQGAYEFVSASAEGGDERILAKGKSLYPIAVACAPDGRLAAVSNHEGNVETVDFASGLKQTLIPAAALGGWLTEMRWAPDGKGLFATYRKTSHFRQQLVYLSYPGGNLRQITNDLSNYAGLDLTADAKTIATTQTENNGRFAELFLKDPSVLTEHAPLGLEWFTWLDNTSVAASDEDRLLKVVNLPKDEIVTLDVAKGHWFAQPSLCGADSLVAAGGTMGGSTVGIYRMHLDGTMATPLTRGPLDIFPVCTAGGKWLFYTDNRDAGHPQLMRLSLRTGVAQAVAVGGYSSLSPDGKLLAISGTLNPSELQLFSTETLQVVKNFSWAPDPQHLTAFSADGKSVFYITRTQAGTTISEQPLDTLAPIKVATLPGKFVESIEDSPDGTRLGLVIRATQTKAVLLRENH